MDEYVTALQKYVEENPPNYGSDAHSMHPVSIGNMDATCPMMIK